MNGRAGAAAYHHNQVEKYLEEDFASYGSERALQLTGE